MDGSLVSGTQFAYVNMEGDSWVQLKLMPQDGLGGTQLAFLSPFYQYGGHKGAAFAVATLVFFHQIPAVFA